MSYFTDGEILIGLDKALGISKEKTDKPMYAKFVSQINDCTERFTNVLKNARIAEIAWHAEIAETKDIIKPAKQMYIKWKRMLLDNLPGAELTGWAGGNVTPDEVEVAIDNIMSVIEVNKEKINFADEALSELDFVSSELDKELDEDRESYRKYRQLINDKNEVRAEAKGLFFSIRRFVRMDYGSKSVEYGQLKDRAVREASASTGSATGDNPPTAV